MFFTCLAAAFVFLVDAMMRFIKLLLVAERCWAAKLDTFFSGVTIMSLGSILLTFRAAFFFKVSPKVVGMLVSNRPSSWVFSGLISNWNVPLVTILLIGEGEPAIVWAYSLALRSGESKIFSPISASSLTLASAFSRRSISRWY